MLSRMPGVVMRGLVPSARCPDRGRPWRGVFGMYAEIDKPMPPAPCEAAL